MKEGSKRSIIIVARVVFHHKNVQCDDIYELMFDYITAPSCSSAAIHAECMLVAM